MNIENKVLIHIVIALDYIDYNTNDAITAAKEHLELARRIAGMTYRCIDYKDQIYLWLAWICNKQGDYHGAISFCEKSIHIAEERLSAFSINQYHDPIIAINNKYFLKVPTTKV